MLEAQGINPGGITGPFAAVQLVPVGDPEVDLSSYRVDRLDCEIRIVTAAKDYRLEIRFGDGAWQPEGGGMIDATTAGVIMARKQIKPVDSDAVGVALNRLTKHPAVADLYDRRALDAKQLTPQESLEHTRQVKEAMANQRRSNALHREPVVEEVGAWIADMLP
jgi:hypothetical protein